ncbi:hypothetical protein [Halococcoides cellulosivorans]|uniref:Uncharacterized protein n=1 Tax=Halococcoides cellulosivorans TaxID=1679096 RepID=A0A2R4WZ23_9EURY|nr:hypothetical protein [Halococcoides cellulosivorans]AWB26765.1 hypothetical protein HARCEL1_03060 [Halococcoides cellulosivorans]
MTDGASSVDPSDLDVRTVTADQDGRVDIGSEYAGRTVTVAVLDPAAAVEDGADDAPDSIESAWSQACEE